MDERHRVLIADSYPDEAEQFKERNYQENIM